MNDLTLLHDGRLIYDLPEPENGRVCNYWVMRLDIATGKRLEEPRRLTNWPSFCVFSGSASKDGKRLAFATWSSFSTTYIGDLEAGGTRLQNTRHFTLEDSDNGARGWTADGKVVVVKQTGGSWKVYKQSLDWDVPEPIMSSAADGWMLLGAISPDDKWYIARVWPKGANPDHLSVPLPILRIPLNGGSPETVLQLARHANVSCARPPSKTCVIAEQSEDRKQMVISIFDPIKGRGPELVRFDFERELKTLDVPPCVISPDGRRLAIARSPESQIEIYSLHGQLIQRIPSQSLGTLIFLVWAMDQKGLFATRNAQGGNELLHLDLQGSVTSLRKCVGFEGCFGLPSPDGRHLAIVDTNQSRNMWMMENF
jgi:hypothetical protein